MLRLSFSSLLILALFGAPGAAYANGQAALDGYFAPWSGPNGLSTLRHLASCVVERHPGAAQSIVREVGGDAELRARTDQLIDSKCIKMFFFRSSRTSISPPTYLPLLAEALLKRDYVAAQLPSVEAVAPLNHPALPDVPIESVHPRHRDSFIVDKALVQLELATECVARAEPAKVLLLASALPDSPAEREALAALDSASSSCGRDSLQHTFPTFARRGALVMNLYRLVDAARPVAHREVAPDA